MMVKKGKRKPGRPVSRWTETARADLLAKLQAYILTTPIPILAEFAWKNGVTRAQLYTFEELASAIKLCHEKKEAQLERLGLQGKIQKTVAIFSLKQLGWRDRVDIEHSGAIDPVQGMTPAQRAATIAALIAKRDAG